MIGTDTAVSTRDQISEIIQEAIEGLDFSTMDAELAEQVEQHCKSIFDLNLPAIQSHVTSEIEKKIEERLIRRVEVIRPDGTEHEIEGHTHIAFERVLQLASMRKAVFLPGPAGCGKTHLAAQVAEALDIPFGFLSCSSGMSESQLLGRLIPRGKSGSFKYAPSRFVECYEGGGAFMLDEIDAADPNALLVVNAAVSNGRLSLPARVDNPVAERHEDFVFIAAANTYGRGADRNYVGRNELDAATLDRFRIGTVPMDYDLALELALCPMQELRETLQKIREACVDCRSDRIISTRFLKDAFDMVHAGLWTYEDVESALFSGWRDDEIDRVRQWIKDH